MLNNGERALAYVVSIDEVKPIEGYDRVEYARTNGWWVVVSKKDNLKVGDKCVYFEIDSKLPEKDERFKFLEPKHYKVKTQKMCGVISQGLLMPLTLFPEIKTVDINTDCTNTLGVIYSVAEDNQRKKSSDPNARYKSIGARHPKLAKTRLFRWMMRHKLGRMILYLFFGNKKDSRLNFPSFIKKTDEERVENQPWRVGDGKEYVMTEKLDGTSSTYVLERKGKKKFEFYVCSRNVRLRNESQKTYHDHNIYWDMALKYNIEQHLREYLDDHKELKWVCIQGESVGAVQGNPLKLKEDDLYIFNFITSEQGRFSSFQGSDIIKGWGMKWVPILGTGETQPTMEELKAFADGKSAVNPDVLREGIVYRSLDGTDSFKNVSRRYLLKHGE